MTEHPYTGRAYAAAAGRDPGQTGFLQALECLYERLAPCWEEHPIYGLRGLAERLAEPEKTCLFPVVWTDDRGQTQLNRGFYIQHSTALGPCRGGLVFRPGLDLSTAKTLALEATLSHSLAGLAHGGSLAGADVAPGALSDGESLRFCRGFMEGLFPYMDGSFHPADWAGQVPAREADHLAGQYERLAACLGGGGRAAPTEGAMSRAQAVGYGLCRFAQHALRRAAGLRLEGQAVLIAGCGGAGLWAGEMALRLGAQVVAVGDESGCLFAAAGLPLALLRDMAREPGLPLLLWAIRAPGVEYRPGPGLWDIPADVIFLCGGAAHPGAAAARRIVSRRPAGIFESAPMACTALASRVFADSGGLYGPAIAAGAGGDIIACRQREGHVSQWEADRLLRDAMGGIFRSAWDEASAAGHPNDLAQGASMAAFRRLADAVIKKGL